MPTLVKTIGCEIEFANADREVISERILPHVSGWDVVHDGSCTKNIYMYPETDEPILNPLTSLSTLWGIRRHLYGGELVSPIIDTTIEGWFDPIAQVISMLKGWEKELDPTTSIHVHVNVGGRGFPLRYFHNLVRLIMYVEAGLYRLSCAESRKHRGLTNEFLYCRPNSKPPCTYVYDRDYICPSFSNAVLLETEDLHSVMQALGRQDRQTSKYVPARYVGVNFISLFTLGSVEFRTFNNTFNPDYVKAWIELSRHLVELSLNDLAFDFESLPEHPLGCESPEFSELVERLWIPAELITTLEELWNIGTFSPEPQHLMTHISNNRIDWSGAENLRPGTIPSHELAETPRQEEPSPANVILYDLPRYPEDSMELDYGEALLEQATAMEEAAQVVGEATQAANDATQTLSAVTREMSTRYIEYNNETPNIWEATTRSGEETDV